MVSSHSPGTLWEVVVAGKMKNHFTLPLVERKSMSLAGYVHASWTHPVLMGVHFRGFREVIHITFIANIVFFFCLEWPTSTYCTYTSIYI